MTGADTDAEVERMLRRYLVPFWRMWRRWTPPADSARLMADLRLDGDSFYEFAEEFAERFCAPLAPPPPGPKGAVEICPPDLSIGDWKRLAREGRWPQDYWMVG